MKIFYTLIFYTFVRIDEHISKSPLTEKRVNNYKKSSIKDL